MEVPDDPPECCPVCSVPYESVSVHEEGLMVNMRENERYSRVCLSPRDADGTATLEFYHHAHAQVHEGADASVADAPDG
ncbi:MAG: hypothetical protein A07HB70_00458 [uncultured archaeon A07HB70]|jgi:hypothetical protein|nr:MAG: hypothetical protein A07HB70_00458 [uncultured archaeon A07HB70]